MGAGRAPELWGCIAIYTFTQHLTSLTFVQSSWCTLKVIAIFPGVSDAQSSPISTSTTPWPFKQNWPTMIDERSASFKNKNCCKHSEEKSKQVNSVKLRPLPDMTQLSPSTVVVTNLIADMGRSRRDAVRQLLFSGGGDARTLSQRLQPVGGGGGTNLSRQGDHNPLNFRI